MNDNITIREEWDNREQIDVMQEGVGCMLERKECITNINDVIKEYAKRIGVDAPVYKKFRNHYMTHGRGWGNDCIDKGAEKVSHPDTISAAFRKFFEVIDVFSQCGMINELEPYFKALAERGVSVSIEASIAERNSENTQDAMDGYDITCAYGENIWNIDEKLTDVLAPEAEAQGLVPKNKYKEIVKFMCDIMYGNGKTDKIQERISKETDNNIMHNNALHSL